MRYSLNIIRYLSFEINRTCPNSEKHLKCPVDHPERYRYNKSQRILDISTILEFWRWCKVYGFRGIVMFHMYNEPVLEMDRIYLIKSRMLEEDPQQPFQLTTSIPGDYSDFDIVKISNYMCGAGNLDDRILTCEGEGKPYSQMPTHGWCGRGLGWEIPIDYYGNWCLCCNDWRCEESIGNIFSDNWGTLMSRWQDKRKRIQWHNLFEYQMLPRMCRSCLDKNPSLSKRGGI